MSKYKGIDERTIKCASEKKKSIEGGISFDKDGSDHWLRFHFLEDIMGESFFQHTKAMKLSEENITQLINELRDIKKELEDKSFKLTPEEKNMILVVRKLKVLLANKR